MNLIQSPLNMFNQESLNLKNQELQNESYLLLEEKYQDVLECNQLLKAQIIDFQEEILKLKEEKLKLNNTIKENEEKFLQWQNEVYQEEQNKLKSIIREQQEQIETETAKSTQIQAELDTSYKTIQKLEDLQNSYTSSPSLKHQELSNSSVDYLDIIKIEFEQQLLHLKFQNSELIQEKDNLQTENRRVKELYDQLREKSAIQSQTIDHLTHFSDSDSISSATFTPSPRPVSIQRTLSNSSNLSLPLFLSSPTSKHKHITSPSLSERFPDMFK
ncbi:hypothetical protein CONCODRAFT_79111 [Conidiobolus coronatus NRRL 28638]|uniref:Uncharacterized protein n=1 Tax=Conidiobolus coronatus (strain ATCC 28846 / CBS 209.66 / NRRL 28638) TaxID=796925 RepID=A0A137P4I5_CONC2|nr:hypothetical protein CONCODRAFT_79111 [Conidiobolus coronatus NRRL 28638]|eukprot:KXN69859.1 hypothetical protein CONCODRAFT_79111 [Conidiobolus coronatus NRRL 28638]